MTGRVKRSVAIHSPKKSILNRSPKGEEIILSVTLNVSPESHVACQIWVEEIFKFVYSIIFSGDGINDKNIELDSKGGGHPVNPKIVGLSSNLTSQSPPPLQQRA